jgi:hypothetical protein
MDLLRSRWSTLCAATLLTTASCTHESCAGVGVAIRPPADTAVTLHTSIVLEAGFGGRCSDGPVTIDEQTHWVVGDTTIISFAVLDSAHVRITGLAIGTTSVTASSLHLMATTTLITVSSP